MKHGYLSLKGDKSLTTAVKYIITDFLSTKTRTYIIENKRILHSYRFYTREIPKYLVNRPKNFIDISMKNLEKCKYLNKSDIVFLDDYLVRVRSQSNPNHFYEVNFGSEKNWPKCECEYFTRNFTLCKHFYAIIYFFNYMWVNISPMFLNHQYNIIDENVLDDDERKKHIEVMTFLNKSFTACDLKTEKNNGDFDNKENLELETKIVFGTNQPKKLSMIKLEQEVTCGKAPEAVLKQVPDVKLDMSILKILDDQQKEIQSMYYRLMDPVALKSIKSVHKIMLQLLTPLVPTLNNLPTTPTASQRKSILKTPTSSLPLRENLTPLAPTLNNLLNTPTTLKRKSILKTPTTSLPLKRKRRKLIFSDKKEGNLICLKI